MGVYVHFYRTIYTINRRDEFCMVSAYCLDYHNWVCIPRHIREDFAEMKDMGFDAVDLSFSESEERQFYTCCHCLLGDLEYGI